MDAKMTVVESIVLDSMDAIVGSFQGISETISQITEQTIPLAQALSEATIEFEKFAGVNAELADGIIKTGMGFGFTAEESLSAGAKMAQLTALIGESSVQAATEMGQTFALISGMGTTEAMTRLINLQQQTSFMYGNLTKAQFDQIDSQQQANMVREQTMEILDQLNTVENRSAASMKQLTFVMNQFAAQAHQTGESIANMAAMSAVLIESGEEQGKAGRALRMIYARLGADTSGAQEAVQGLGIATHDANTGALRPLSAIVEDLAVKFKDLGAEERQRIVQTVAGNDHYVRFIKLIENQGRMTELATDAIVNQSTATEELNRVIEDQSTALKEAQAELQHNQALLGQALVPAYTKATEVQARFTLGLAQLSETGIGNTFATGIIILQRYGQILGGVFDTYLNIKSVNIAMKTHMAILRAINGEELVRTDTHRMRNTLATSTLSIDERIAAVNEQIAFTKLLIQDFDMKTGHIRQNIVRTEQQLAFETQKINALVEERNALHMTELQHKTHLNQIAMQMFSTEQNNADAVRRRAMMTALEAVRLNDAQVQSMRLTNMELMKQSVFIETIKLRKQQAHQLEMNELAAELAGHQTIIRVKTLELTNTKARTAAAAAIRAGLKEEIALSTTRAAQIALDITQKRTLFQNEAQNSKMTSAFNNKEISENEKLLDQEFMIRNLLEDEAAKKSRLAAIDDELILALQQQGISKQQLNYLLEEEIAYLPVLAGLKGNLSDEERKLNQELLAQIIQRRQLNSEGLRTEPLLDSMSMGMTKLSMAAGMASMSVHLLSGVLGIDDEKSMRVSMILMTMSMIPAMAQMAMMTKSMTSLGIATQGATMKLKGFKAALAATGVGLALILGAFAIEKFLMKTKDATDELNDSLETTVDLLGKLTAEDVKGFEVPVEIHDELGAIVDLSTATQSELKNMSRVATEEIAAIDEAMQGLAADDPQLAHLADRKKALKEFDDTIRQQESVVINFKYKNTETMSEDELIRMVLGDLASGDLGEGMEMPVFLTYKTTSGYSSSDPYGVTSNMPVTKLVEDPQRALDRLNGGFSEMADLTDEGREFIMRLANSASYMANNFSYASDDMVEDIVEITDGFTKAEAEMRSFANAREELFFGGRSQYMTGEMMKQVVNKGVENLYSNVELLMTNNFYGMTFDEAVNEISNRITDQLVSQGVPLNSN